MIRPVALAIAAFLLVANAAPEGTFARQARSIWEHFAGHSSTSTRVSPDGRTRVLARYTETDDDAAVTLSVRGAVGVGKVALVPGVGSELLWAPDSSAFAVTTSDGGATGTYRTLVVGRGRDGGLRVVDLSPLIRRAFGHPVRCGWPEEPNVGAIQWQAGAQRIVVAAEIITHSNCDSFGTFRAYEVDWRAGRIVRRFDQIEAKRRFAASLGVELQGASDDCVRQPRRCWVSTNHDGATR